MSKKLKIVVLASIILNVLLIGVVLGHLPRRLDADSSREERIEKALKKLPDPARSRLREKIDRLRATAEPTRDQIREARSEVIRILVAEPFDEAAYDTEVNRMSELRAQMSQKMAKSFKDLVKELPPDERRVLAEMLQRP
jgi:uncharacterized membrane protein